MKQTTPEFIETLMSLEEAGGRNREEINSAAVYLAEKYLSAGDDRQDFPSEMELFSLCGLAGLDFYRTLIVVLRSQFERYAVESCDQIGRAHV